MKRLSLGELEVRTRSLDAEIRRIERRGSHMTPQDLERAAILKRMRLQTKDQLDELKRAG
jgi:uncharacterized protein YdcH (DUF465 family)